MNVSTYQVVYLYGGHEHHSAFKHSTFHAARHELQLLVSTRVGWSAWIEQRRKGHPAIIHYRNRSLKYQTGGEL